MFQTVFLVTFQTVLIVSQVINVPHVLQDLISQLQIQMFVPQLVMLQIVSNVQKVTSIIVQFVNQDFNCKQVELLVNQFL